MIAFLKAPFLFFFQANKFHVSIETTCASLSSCLFRGLNLCSALQIISCPWTIDSNFLSPSRIWKNIPWYYTSDPHWNVLFLSTYLELRQWTCDSSSWKVDKISIFKKSFEPTSKIHLIFWLVPQTPLFFFDFWGINLVRTTEVTQKLLACAERKRKLSHWRQNYHGCGCALSRIGIEKGTIILENIKELGRGDIIFYGDKATRYIKSRGELFPTGENIKKLQTISWQAEAGIAGIYSIWQ